MKFLTYPSVLRTFISQTLGVLTRIYATELRANSNFHTAYHFYDFDQKLRILAFTEIAKIEVAIRSALANIASKETGNLFWMTDISMYANADRFRKTMNFIDKELNTSKEDFIIHFKRKIQQPLPTCMDINRDIANRCAKPHLWKPC